MHFRYIRILSKLQTISCHNGQKRNGLQDCSCEKQFVINNTDDPVNKPEVDSTSKDVSSFLSFQQCVPLPHFSSFLDSTVVGKGP